jgi:hypothetical protein
MDVDKNRFVSIIDGFSIDSLSVAASRITDGAGIAAFYPL